MRVEIMPSLSEVDRVIDLADRFARQSGFALALTHRLKIVAEELARNVILHGEPTAENPIALSLEGTKTEIEIALVDRGRPFDPRTDLDTPVRGADTAPEIEGGAGWPLILEWCQIESYERVGEENRLRLTLTSGT